MQKAFMPQPTDGPFVERADVLSWGRVIRQPQRVAKPHFRDELSGLIAEAPLTSKLAIGLRRSYGDSCLNGAPVLVDAAAGRRALRLRLLSAQRVWSVVVDANSGRVLSGG